MKDQLNKLNDNIGDTLGSAQQLKNVLDEILGGQPEAEGVSKATEKPYGLSFIFDDYNLSHTHANNFLNHQVNRLIDYVSGGPSKTISLKHLGGQNANR